MNRARQIIGLVVCIAICLGVGMLGRVAMGPSADSWYRDLTKPSWTPPGWVFGPVWSMLYVMMATAAWLLWRQAGFRAAAVPLTLFALQLSLNLTWSLVFFGLQQPGWALVELVVLLATIIVTAWSFFGRSRAAAVLMLPYALWVAFAGVLNAAIWLLSRPAAA